jgi:hypothetical protein
MCAAEEEEGGGEAEMPPSALKSASRYKPRSIYRRLFGYVKEAWTGVKFALGQ